MLYFTGKLEFVHYIFSMIVELNWLCKNIKKARSSQPAILVLNCIKHSFSLLVSLKRKLENLCVDLLQQYISGFGDEILIPTTAVKELLSIFDAIYFWHIIFAGNGTILQNQAYVFFS